MKTVPFAKLEALGNSYIVVEPAHKAEWTEEEIRTWCSEEYGIGSDGILWGPHGQDSGVAKLVIYNIDGSRAEKSGNGLRIFARYLYDSKLVKGSEFDIEVDAGLAKAKVFEDGSIEVSMGQGELLGEVQETLEVKGKSYDVTKVSVGNPHCCVFGGFEDPADVKTVGRYFEKHSAFPNRTNVQFVSVRNEGEIFFEVWERGSGYTLASGSSSCAVALAAKARGLVGDDLRLKMPGGELKIRFADEIMMTGPVEWICRGEYLKSPKG